MDLAPSKELYTTLNPDFHADSDSGKPVYAARHALQVLARMARLPSLGEHFAQTHAGGDQIDSVQVDVKVKMAKVRHKDLLTVRYFFIEILENQRAFG